MKKIAYGMGDAGSNFCWTFVASFIMLYCTNIIGVSATIIGTLMMVSKVLDGVTDVFMGRVIDKTHSRMGKARFWLFISTFPVAIFTILMFNCPGGMSGNSYYVYFFIVYTLLGAVFYTMNNIAYSSLTALATRNSEDRVQMGSYRFIFAILALLFISTFTTGMVDHFGGGRTGWTATSVVYGILCFAFLMIPVIAIRELPEEESKKIDADTSDTGFFKGFVYLLKNKYFIMILLIYLAMYLSNGITSGMGIYFARYQLNNDALLGAISMAGYLPIVLVLPFVPRLTAKFGIRRLALYGSVLSLAGAVLLIAGGLMGSFAVVMTGLVIKAIGRAPLTGSLNALIAEAAEYTRLKDGKNLTGTFYSCSSVGIKVGTGIGTAVCGILLDASGFNGLAQVQTASAVSAISWCFLLAHAIPVVIFIIILFFMNVEDANRKLRAEEGIQQ